MNSPGRGYNALNSAKQNKSTAFTRAEREALGLRGLLPYTVSSLEAQEQRALKSLRRKHYDIEKYIFLNGLKERSETLFYRLLIDHIEEIMPLIYTPTVGEACREFANIFRKPQGFYITPEDRGRHSRNARQLARRRRAHHRRHRRRTHPRPRRSRRQRHGHPDRQAVAVLRRCGHPSASVYAGHAGCRYQQRRTAQ